MIRVWLHVPGGTAENGPDTVGASHDSGHGEKATSLWTFHFVGTVVCWDVMPSSLDVEQRECSAHSGIGFRQPCFAR